MISTGRSMRGDGRIMYLHKDFLQDDGSEDLDNNIIIYLISIFIIII